MIGEKKLISIPKDNFISGSHGVFQWNGGVYRGFDDKLAPDARRLILNLDKLYDIGLVRTSIAPLHSKEFGLILQHEKIDFVTYIEEWTTKMVLDAALMVIDLQAELVKNELCLYDGHSLNVTFDYTKPVFVDFGSIIPIQTSIAWFDGFFPYFIRRITEHAKEDSSFWFKSLETTINLREAQTNVSSYKVVFLKFLNDIRDWLSSMNVNIGTTPWSGYTQPTEELTNDKQKTVANILGKLYTDGMTLIDIGANQGWYSNFAANIGYHVVAFDLDEKCMTKLYLEAKQSRHKILPLIEDFLRPWKAQPPYINEIDRLKCDVSLALALVHHLVFSQHTDFPTIALRLSELTKRYSIVEFPPPDDVFVKNWITPETSWYNIDNFIAEMSGYFPKNQVFDSHPKPRKIILFEK